MVGRQERKGVSREQRGGEKNQINSCEPLKTINWNQNVAVVSMTYQSKKSGIQIGKRGFMLPRILSTRW